MFPYSSAPLRSRSAPLPSPSPTAAAAAAQRQRQRQRHGSGSGMAAYGIGNQRSALVRCLRRTIIANRSDERQQNAVCAGDMKFPDINLRHYPHVSRATRCFSLRNMRSATRFALREPGKKAVRQTDIRTDRRTDVISGPELILWESIEDNVILAGAVVVVSPTRESKLLTSAYISEKIQGRMAIIQGRRAEGVQ
jgi:hypothetical protein